MKKSITTGKVFICGAGPGDPKLITLKAIELLKTCGVVLYDRLVSEEIIAQIPPTSKKIYVGRATGDSTNHQDKTNDLMVRYANRGEKVLRLKGGDPFIFGRGGEEAEYLFQHNIKFEIIPGITSAIGSAVYAGIPLTHRQFSSSIAIVTGHESLHKDQRIVKWEKLANAVDTIVIMMGIGQLKQISSTLIKAGMNKNTQVAIVENGTTKKQRLVKGTLGNIVNKSNEAQIQPPAIIMIGKVISLQDKLAWYGNNN
jgi:uroporphyrin-III C-methyltransferase